MASALSIAIAKQDAIARIDGHLGRLSKEKGQEYAPLPVTGRDPMALSKDQLVLIADALDALLGKPAEEPSEANVAKVITDDEAAKMPDTRPEDVDSARKTDKPTVKSPAKGKG